MDYYLLDENGEKKGPYSLEQVRAMWEAGKVNLDTFHWTEGMTEWQPLRTIEKTIYSKRVQVKKALAPSVTPRVSTAADWVQKTQAKKPAFNWSFIYYAFLFVVVAGVMTYFIFPNAVDSVIALAYPPPPQELPQRPVVVTPRPAPATAPPRAMPQVAPPVVPPEPPQKYSIEEIKDAIQKNLVAAGVIQPGTPCDWQLLQYTDEKDVRYELFAHLSGGATKFCTGMVALDPKKHRIIISSQLSG